jgi:hypothetical protein
MNINEEERIYMSPAEKMYSSHLNNVRNYQKRNPEKMREKCNAYNRKLKETNPEKYNELLQKQKEYYKNVRKPRMQLKKLQLLETV